jgi:undecaprenyl-diphosphatase
LGDTAVVLPITIIVFLWLAWKRAWRTAGYWLAAVAGASAINAGIKAALHRARPGELIYSGWSGFSFPSGHSTVNIVMYGFLAFLIARQVRQAWHLPVALGAASLTLLIAFSRLYLGAHWLSDVIGGLAFGTAWLALLGLSYLYHRSEQIEPRGLFAVGCAALVLVGSFNVYRRHTADMEQYAVRRTVPTMVAADWWATDWQQLSARRVDLEGELEEPLTVQLGGSLRGLQDLLLRKGWRASVSWTPSSTLAWLTAKPDPTELPVLPYLDGGRLPRLTLVYPQGDAIPATSRLVLRLWAVDIELKNGSSSPLWIGSVVEERLDHPLSFLTVARRLPDVNTPRELLAAALDTARLVTRTSATATAGWDGRVLLAREGGAPDEIRTPAPRLGRR